MKKLEQIKENNDYIDLESPSSRNMDLSPKALSVILNCSINTIKNRLKKTGLNFVLPESEDHEHEHKYQMYNMECIPILEAYLKNK